MRDLRFALRQFTKSPGFAVAVVLTLALGIGVNTAVFSMVDGFQLRSLPYRQPEKVAALVLHTQGVSPRSGQFFAEDDDSHTGATWRALKDGVQSVTLGSWGGTDGVNLQTSAADGNAIRYVHESRVSADYFDVLGIPLFRGRSFSADEDRPKGPNAVVLGYPLWQSTFHGDPAAIGKAIHLKGESYTVVGILPQGAVTPMKADLFTALQPATSGECGGSNCGILMRLKPGVSWQQTNAELGHIHLREMDEIAKLAQGGAWLYAQPLNRYIGGDMRPKVQVLMLAVSFILVIACANLAGLALVRIHPAGFGSNTPGSSEAALDREPGAGDDRRGGGTGFGCRDPSRSSEFPAKRDAADGRILNRCAGARVHLWGVAADESALWRASGLEYPQGRFALVDVGGELLGRRRFQSCQAMADRK
jgi:hypothetical protein